MIETLAKVDLKMCPFCGAEAKVRWAQPWSNEIAIEVRCNNNDCSASIYRSRENGEEAEVEAIASWNCRK